MTYRELYLRARRRLQEAGVDSPGPDAMALAERFLDVDRAKLAVHGGEEPGKEQESDFLRAVEERAARRPLQYILGSWEFLGLSLTVGEGVLIPREDTAILVEALADRLKKAFPHGTAFKGVDLCAGSGAVALGLCSLLPESEVTCLELSEQAFSFLKKNLAAYPQYRLWAVQGDVLLPETADRFLLGSLDFIASNPPYIKTGELPGLQAEVQKEPVMALDGGPDGLDFYQAVMKLWLPLLKPGGILAVEIGEDQGDPVSKLFLQHGLKDVELLTDWAGLDRCVAGRVPGV